MVYPQWFKDKVKQVFNSPEMDRLAENGSPMLGKWLDDSSTGLISVYIILSAKSLEEIQAIARVETNKRNLYIEWGIICGQQTKNRKY